MFALPRLVSLGSLALGASLVVLAAFPAHAERWRVSVRGQGTELGETPVAIPLSTALPAGFYSLRSDDRNKSLPAQVFNDDGRTFLGAVFDRVAANSPENYTLVPAGESSAHEVALRAESDKVAVVVRGRLFTEYLAKDGPKPYYYPVLGPSGVPLTRSYPMKKVAGETSDHPHQRSLWFTHGKVNGIDFWSEQANHGSIKETSRKLVASGPALGVIRTTDDWVAPDGRVVCKDERVVRFFDTAQTRVMDFDIVIRSPGGPVTFGDTKEGMFGVRVATSMDVDRKKGGRITNAEGITDAAAWGKASPWVDYTGPVQGRTVGVAILNHPSSFRFPTTWHVRTYGLFAANPFGWHDFGRKESGQYTIPAGEAIHFAYRLILHDGDTASAGLPTAFEGYAKPPVIEVQRAE
jgi:hypothetical protein